ncbi:MAG: hypothetical protein ACUVUC_00690 [Thermoguttaceae bacterium]
MSVWNKVLLGLIFLVSLGFFYFGASALRIHQHWRTRIAVLEKDLQAVEDQKQSLLDGQQGIHPLTVDLTRLTAGRGEVWHACLPQRIDAGSGQVWLQVSGPPPRGADSAGFQVFVFQDSLGAPDNLDGLYLGEFSVRKVDKQAEKVVAEGVARELDRYVWQLEPSKAVTEDWLRGERLRRLGISSDRLRSGKHVSWTVYRVLPQENIFLTRVGGEKPLPTPSAKQPEGQPAEGPSAAPQTDQQRAEYWKKVVDQYAPQLCDYEVLFNDFYRQRAIRADQINKARRHLAMTEAAIKDAETLVAGLKQDVSTSLQELGQRRREAQDAETLRKGLQATCSQLEAEIQDALQTSRKLAAELARLQLEGARQIDQRTRGMAQTVPGR